ncbi:MAG: transcription antitermination factor NusB [Actinobacteria bacterium]|nr:transcription antitermination factor NusB [Actinomycetota bacterium]
MSARHKARKRALDVLYESEIKNLPISEIWQQRTTEEGTTTNPYTEQLVLGIALNLDAIDQKITQVSTGWRLERMSPVDRSLIRIAAYEILFRADVDIAVAINESVLLAKEISSEEAPSFINGVLGAIATLPEAAKRSAV